MKRIMVSVFGCWLAAASGLALDFTLSDSSMAWDDQMWLGMSISNIAVEGGVDLKLYVDIDGDGSVNGDDFLLTLFEVDDGETNWFGAQTFVDDKDGVADGAIETALPMFGISYNPLHTIGTYVWEAVEINESEEPIATATATFEVTQPTGTVWVSGQVRDYITSNAVAGAHVDLEYYSDTVGLPPSVWADTNGQYVLYLPDGITTNDVAFVLASSKGTMSVEYHPDTYQPISGHVVTQALSSGENVLPDLYVVPEHTPYELYTVQGTVYRVEPWEGGFETNALGGVIVDCELEDDEDDGPEVLSWDVTDANGQFSLVIPGDDEDPERELWCESPQLNLRGIVGSWITADVTGTVNGVEIYLHDAKALARGRVEARASGEPLTGVELFFEDETNRYTSSAFTLTNGTYEVGLMPGTYYGECEYDALIPLGYLSLPGTNGIIVNEGSVVSNINFAAEQGYLIDGYVSDTNSNPLTEGYIGLLKNNEWGTYWIGDTDVRFDGYYELLSPTGGVYVQTQGFGDYYVDMYHSNQPLCAMSDVDPLTVTTGGVSGVDFQLPEGARVKGAFWYNGEFPAEWRRINALIRNASNEWICIGGGNTEWGGSFDFAVPAGAEVYLRTDVDYGWMAP
ncbi:MAG TPA: hypothetical protein VJ904_05435, partial [Tichowtungia sp.]|nr:hypothetical protein [Tichowtungia sp.]